MNKCATLSSLIFAVCLSICTLFCFLLCWCCTAAILFWCFHLSLNIFILNLWNSLFIAFASNLISFVFDFYWICHINYWFHLLHAPSSIVLLWFVLISFTFFMNETWQFLYYIWKIQLAGIGEDFKIMILWLQVSDFFSLIQSDLKLISNLSCMLPLSYDFMIIDS